VSTDSPLASQYLWEGGGGVQQYEPVLREIMKHFRKDEFVADYSLSKGDLRHGVRAGLR